MSESGDTIDALAGEVIFMAKRIAELEAEKKELTALLTPLSRFCSCRLPSFQDCDACRARLYLKKEGEG